MSDLGEKTYFSMASFLFEMDVVTCGNLVDEIIKTIGMEKAHEEAVFHYPFNGKGDGFIYIQPIIESFISIDYWDHLKGGYLVVCSCRPFQFLDIENLLKSKSIKVLNVTFDSIGINNNE